MATRDYEVREDYREYSVTQLLNAPVTCFQGVGDIQSEILEQYFQVKTVRDLANLPHFLEALNIEELVLTGGPVLKKTVKEASQDQPLSFTIRPEEQRRKVSELLDAPAHLLANMTPAQDLALYDAFRITNLAHLAHNRIMLEARVIDYLAGEEAGSEEDRQSAIHTILGRRQASSAGERADSRAAQMAEEMSKHVQDRLSALRTRNQDRGATSAREERAEGTGGVASRLDSIRESRERGTPRSRVAAMDEVRGKAETSESRGMRPKPGPSSRLDEIMATRGERTGGERGAPTRPGVDAASRAAGISAMRDGKVSGVASAPTSGGKSAKPAAATALKTKKDDIELPTEAAPVHELPTEGRTNRAPLYAAAAVAALLLIGLVAWFISGGGEEAQVAQTTQSDAAGQQPGQGGGGAATPGSGTGTQPGGDAGKPGAPDMSQGTAGTQPGATQPGAAQPGQPAQPGATPGTAAGTGAAVGTVTGGTVTYQVKRGDSLWRISDDRYNDPLNWPSIYQENQGKIDNPDLIFPKQKFTLPSNPQQRFPEHPKGYKRSR